MGEVVAGVFPRTPDLHELVGDGATADDIAQYVTLVKNEVTPDQAIVILALALLKIGHDEDSARNLLATFRWGVGAA